MDIAYEGKLDAVGLITSLRASTERDQGVWESKAHTKGHALEGKKITWGPERIERRQDAEGNVTIAVKREMIVKEATP